MRRTEKAGNAQPGAKILPSGVRPEKNPFPEIVFVFVFSVYMPVFYARTDFP